MSNFERLFRTSDEQLTPVAATITGSVPDWLDGSLLRIGPGLFDLDSGFVMNHFFDGYAIIHKFDISNGKVELTKKYLRSEAYEKTIVDQKPAYTEFATRAYANHATGFLARAFGNVIPDMTDNCNVSIVKIGSSYFATKGSAILRVIHPEDLSTGEKIELHPLLGADMPPRLCPFALKDNLNDTYLITSAHPNGQKYEVVKIPDNPNTSFEAFKNVKRVCTVQSKCNSFFYSFGMTERYIVLIEQPFTYNRTELRAVVVKGVSMKDCLSWNPEQMNRFYIIDKATGDVIPTKYESKQAFFFFHHINTYELDGEIIADIIGYDGPDVVNQLSLVNLRGNDCNPEHPSQGRRFIIPIVDNINDEIEGENLVKKPSSCEAIKNGKRIVLSPQVICPSPHELQNINSKYLGKQYTYYYATGFVFPGENKFSVIKVNVESGEVSRWFAGNDQLPSEPVFVEKPNSVLEDDGILLVSVTTSLPGDKDRLVILDASSMELVAAAAVSCHVPVTRRGIFIPRME